MKREQRIELLCQLTFELLSFISNLTFEDAVKMLKEDPEVVKNGIRVMRNNLLNWMRQDNRFSFSNSGNCEDIMISLSEIGRKKLYNTRKNDKVVAISRHVHNMIPRVAS